MHEFRWSRYTNIEPALVMHMKAEYLEAFGSPVACSSIKFKIARLTGMPGRIEKAQRCATDRSRADRKMHVLGEVISSLSQFRMFAYHSLQPWSKVKWHIV